MLFTFQGVIPAIWTPTDSEGQLLKEDLRANLDFVLGAGVESLLVLGSTGEFVHLSVAQRKEVLETTIEHAKGTPVLVNISHTNPRVVLELGWHARAAGAVAVTCLPPWFFPMSDADLIEFFAYIGQNVGLPLALYNFAALTGKRLTPEIVRGVASRTGLIGLKHSAGEMQEHKPLVEVGREFNFNVVTGWDTHIPEAMGLGAKGCISGLANLVPELVLKVYQLVAAGRLDEARAPAGQMRRIGEVIDQIEFPHNVAAAMEARGLHVGKPKTIVSTQTNARYAKVREQIRGLLDEFGLPCVR